MMSTMVRVLQRTAIREMPSTPARVRACIPAPGFLTPIVAAVLTPAFAAVPFLARYLPSFIVLRVLLVVTVPASFAAMAAMAAIAAQPGAAFEGPAVAGNETAPKPEARDDAAGMPWRPGMEYVYTWTYERERVGETRFRVVDLRSEDDAARGPDRYRIDAAFDYKRDAVAQKIRRHLFLDAGWSMLRYTTRADMEHARGITSIQETQGWLEGRLLAIEVIHGGRKERRVRTSMPLEGAQHIFLTHAVESWAIFLARHLDDGRLATAKVAFPDFGKVFTVDFTLAGKEKIEVGKEKIETRHFRFRSTDRQFSGETWLDDSGRLVRYRQGALTIQLTGVGKKVAKTG